MAVKKMKACLYSPYIPKHFGGGEKYLFDVALVLAQKYEVVMAVPQNQAEKRNLVADKQAYESFLNTSLEKITFLPSPLGTKTSLKEKVLWTKQFDLMYYLTDGSLFLSLAKKNILHLQIPFSNSMTSPLQRMKLLNWKVRNANSIFTQQIVQQHWRVQIPFVHYPAVELSAHQSQTKQPVILHVGRFFKNLHTKRQDILVKAFRQLLQDHKSATKGWKLVFIGAVEDEAYLKEVKKLARDLPIEFYHDLSRSELEKWYAQASIYWHATGFGVDVIEHPEKMEHFGISTAEAMMAGCVPIVLGQGGQLEVLGHDLRAWSWQTIDEAVAKTLDVIEHPQLRMQLQAQAKTRSQAFNHQAFAQTLWKMVDQA